MLRAAQTDAHQTVARPAQPVPLQNAIQLRRGHHRCIAASAERLPSQRFRKLRTFRALFDTPDRFAQRINFLFGVKFRIARWIVVVLQLFRHAPVAHAHDVARRKMHQAGMVALAQKIQQMKSRIHIRSKRVAQVRIEIRQPRAVHH